MAGSRHRAAFVVGAFVGGVAGAAVTLWNAPQAGARTRAQLGDRIVRNAGPLGGPLANVAVGMNAVGRGAFNALAGRGGATGRSAAPTEPITVTTGPVTASARPDTPAPVARSEPTLAPTPLTASVAPAPAPVERAVVAPPRPTAPDRPEPARAPTPVAPVEPRPPRVVAPSLSERAPAPTPATAPPQAASRLMPWDEPTRLTDAERQALDLNPVVRARSARRDSSGSYQTATDVAAALAAERNGRG